MTTKNLLRPLAAATALLSGLLAAPAAMAQDVTTLKVHFFLPATSYAATLFIRRRGNLAHDVVHPRHGSDDLVHGFRRRIHQR